MSLKIEIVKSKRDYAFCVYIRNVVFVQEQKCDWFFEIDEYEDGAVDYLGWADGKPAATARYRMYAPDTAKLERMAVLKEHRKKGYGRAMMEKMTEDLKKLPHVKKIVMSAQDHTISLYEKIGYRVVGEGYLEANIPHHKMEMIVRGG